MSKTKPSRAKTCPNCGNDTFLVAKTWYGRERFIESKGIPSMTMEVVDEKDYEYTLMECDNCQEEITAQELFSRPYQKIDLRRVDS